MSCVDDSPGLKVLLKAEGSRESGNTAVSRDGGGSRSGHPATVLDLARVGVPRDFLEHTVRRLNTVGGLEERDFPLTPLQQAVFSDSRVFAGANLVVAGPTSGGKTMIANALAAAQGGFKARTLFLVPLRALVTEKAEELEAALPRAAIIRASSDYPRSDALVRRGDWDVLVVVFDKLLQWLCSPPYARAVLDGSWTVIVDEIQMLVEEERGAKLEMIIAALLWHQRDISGPVRRIIGLTSVHEFAPELGAWMNAQVVPNRPTPRPVPLVEGWVSPMTARTTGRVPFVVAEARGDPEARAMETIVDAALAGYRVLVYCASGQSCVERAGRLKNLLKRCGAKWQDAPSELLEGLDRLDYSPTVERLSELLEKGVGVHFGEMSGPERGLIEASFRNLCVPGVRVLFATRTLCMGVNLPADVVILLDQHTYGRGGEQVPMALHDYRNYIGRAGRYRPGRGRGVGVCLRMLDWEPEGALRRADYSQSTVPPLRAGLVGLDADHFFPHLLTATAAARSFCEDTNAWRRLLQRTLAFHQLQDKTEATKREAEGLLASLDLIEEPGRLNAAGMALSPYGFTHATVKELIVLVRDNIRLFDLFCRIASQAEFTTGRYPRDGGDLRGLHARLSRLIDRVVPRRAIGEAGPAARALAKATTENSEILARALALWCWTTGMSLSRFNGLVAPDGKGVPLSLGVAQKLGFAGHNAVCALFDLGSAFGVDLGEFELLGVCLRHGVPPEVAALPLIAGIERDRQLPRSIYLTAWRLSAERSIDPQDLAEVEPPASEGFSGDWRMLQGALRAHRDRSADDPVVVEVREICRARSVRKLAERGLENAPPTLADIGPHMARRFVATARATLLQIRDRTDYLRGRTQAVGWKMTALRPDGCGELFESSGRSIPIGVAPPNVKWGSILYGEGDVLLIADPLDPHLQRDRWEGDSVRLVVSIDVLVALLTLAWEQPRLARQAFRLLSCGRGKFKRLEQLFAAILSPDDERVLHEAE